MKRWINQEVLRIAGWPAVYAVKIVAVQAAGMKAVKIKIGANRSIVVNRRS